MDYTLNFSGQLKQHLRSIRKARGLTQARLAEALGLYQSRIAEIEANPGAISVEQLVKLLAVLDTQLVLRANPVPASTGALDRNRDTSPLPEGGSQTKDPKGAW